MTVAVTAASGHLGRLTVHALLDRGVPAADIVAGARSPEKIADLAALGVRVREADYDRPDTLAGAFAGVDRLLLISASEVGIRVPQHTNAVNAAVAAGVSLVAYTSAPYADTTDLPIAPEHKATEEVIRASGVPFTFLRNCWYVENYTANLATALQHGAILGSAGDGKVSAAPRADFAAAAAAVLAGDGHANTVYELGGDQPFTLAELAAEVSRQSGRQVVYRDLPPAEYAGALVAAGLPDGYAQLLAASDVSLKEGRLLVETGDLGRLIGRPTTPLSESVAAGLAGLS
ncbi:SDR family oxidoreductase [Phytohabitans houttuyneae]|uniref:NAD(P)-dependent oxidoreductase n=1 Tax=Phytohabitans houttuyneae TaxID=1076126 RepID=A0A6V8KQ84_9ACTN|nr:SDR family oxidoreductase [Phytohabitans houttuyneae]GFJ84551.1 NAD(P)-dependent oxidoreductase [Phytohabitans houttuyneae]